MNLPDYGEGDHDDTVRGLQKAQKTLEDVQAKMKRFKSRRRETSQASAAKAPFPDLSKYFSHLTNEFANQDTEQLLLAADQRSRDVSREALGIDPIFAGRQRVSDKQNCSMTINERLQREKNSSITKIEQYYTERNQILQEKIREMRMIKDKIIRDQRLLLRNNEQLQEELLKLRTQGQQRSSGNDLREKIREMKEKIAAVQLQNGKMTNRKKDLEKHIKEVVKLHKDSLTHEVMHRPKSMSAARCNYH